MDDVDYLVEDNARDDFACAFSQKLEHFHIHQGLPIFVSRILATQRTTMMNTGGRDADAKEDNTVSDLTLARPRKQNLDDRPRDI